MAPPTRAPIGLLLAGTAKAVSRAFDDALSVAGGSLSTWLVLLALRTQHASTQRELAHAVGIRAATLSHHLDRMEADGLLTRRRDPANRRVHRVEVSADGHEMFRCLRAAAVAHDRRLRRGLSEADIATLADLLAHVRRNVGEPGEPRALTPSEGRR